MQTFGPVGMVGLGTMGLPMARNLLRAGYRLVVFDINRDRVELLRGAGPVEVADSPADMASRTKIMILMLPNSPHVESVVEGESGLLDSLQPGSIIVDMSSIAPDVSRRLAQRVEQAGSKMLDAPVSGGETGAINGALTIMVGGEAEVLEKVMPLLEAMGKRIIHCGGPGAGQTVKMVNQLMSAVNLIGMSEGFVLGVKAGVDPEVMMNVISKGSGRCWAIEDRMPVILDGKFDPGFTIDLHTKDINIAMETAKALNVPVYVASLVHELFKTAQAKGKGRKDNSAIITLYEELAGVEVRRTRK